MGQHKLADLSFGLFCFEGLVTFDWVPVRNLNLTLLGDKPLFSCKNF